MKRLILLALLSFGCSVSRPVDSEPQGAMVYLDGALAGKTPCSVEFSNMGLKLQYTLKVEKDGFSTHIQQINPVQEGGQSRWPDSFFVRLAPKK